MINLAVNFLMEYEQQDGLTKFLLFLCYWSLWKHAILVSGVPVLS